MKINWCGFYWDVRPNMDVSAPGPNRWSERLVNVDRRGRLHLRINEVAGVWRCSEVHLERAFGWGRYQFSIMTDIRRLDPQAVLGLFTYDWEAKQEGAGEVDIEFAKWGDSTELTNTEYSVQPVIADTTHRNHRLRVGPPPYHCVIDWREHEVSFMIRDGLMDLNEWKSDYPPPKPSDTTWPFINLWLNKGNEPPRSQEVVLSRFRFSA
jgi:hypothetical protein